jgi:hypothetical protein
MSKYIFECVDSASNTRCLREAVINDNSLDVVFGNFMLFLVGRGYSKESVVDIMGAIVKANTKDEVIEVPEGENPF